MTEVKVRFAPSPTGYLHVGGLRTALYNYLFAKKNNGKFVLRIEDTDRKRFVEGAAENLINTLKVCGLDYDEGPGAEEPQGPYFQSQRLEIYKKHAEELLKNDHAYPCFCSEETLKEMRERQVAEGKTPGYDRRCRRIPHDEALARMKNEPYVLRLKMPEEGQLQFNDLIRGTITIDLKQVDDQVLVKSDDYPTYHLANVVDDHYMGITHVIRGEEWLLSVPKHITLYKMLGWELPVFAHLPLLLNRDRSKLSKRQGDVAVEDYLQKGFMPAALVNFVALLGWNPGDDREIFSMEEMIELFDLNRVNKSGAVFDVEKLKWMNGQYIKNADEESTVAFLAPFVQKAGYDISDKKLLREAVLAVKNSILTGQEIGRAVEIFYKDEVEIKEKKALEIIQSESGKKVMEAFAAQLNSVDKIDVESFKLIMKNVQKETGVKGKELWMSVRVAMTGMTHGPELPSIINAFGKEKMEKLVGSIMERYL